MSKKIIDIFPPKKLKEYYPSLSEEEIREEKKLIEAGKRKGDGLKKGLFFICFCLILVFIFLHFIVAKVEIEIWPETENLNFDEKVTIDAKIEGLNLTSKVIPGKVFEDQRNISQQFSSSGKTLKEKNAQGIIRVYNNYHLPQALVVNTRFQPPLEKVIYFRSTKTVTIPAKSYLDIEVGADRPGQEYNIGPSTFSVPGLAGLPQYYSVYGKSFSPMTGGFKGEVSQIRREDLDEAKKILLEKLEKETRDYLQSSVSEDFILLNEAIFQEIITASSSSPVGAEVDSFDFNLKTKSKIISFRKSDLENFAKELINPQFQNTDKKIQPESLKINYSPESINKELSKIVLSLKISAKIYSDIDLESLKRNLLGKSLKETQLLLEDQPQITKVQIKVFPIWLKKIPQNEEKIRIKLNIAP